MTSRLRPFSLYFTTVLSLVAAVSMFSCSTLKKLKLPGGKDKKAEKEKVASAATPIPKPVFVGTITLVNPDAKFVLIDVGYSSSPTEGLALKSMANGVETAVLAVGKIARRPFAIADIVSGSPGKGDAVFK